MSVVGDETISQLEACLLAWFDRSASYVVALSGGVDSAVVAKALVGSGADAVAATAASASVAAVELHDAAQVANSIGLEHHVVHPNETQDADYQQNNLRRCFFCKSLLYATIAQRFPERVILSGTNFDDLGDYRPGLEAARQAAVRAPLAELSIGKSQVRQLAQLWGLSLADKPASPCLASRIAYGVPVTPERLKRIELAEAQLRDLGLSEFRVRLHADEVARIEVPGERIALLASTQVRSLIVERLKSLGFRFVTLDLEGFRSGSLNPVFQIEAKKTETLHGRALSGSIHHP